MDILTDNTVLREVAERGLHGTGIQQKYDENVVVDSCGFLCSLDSESQQLETVIRGV